MKTVNTHDAKTHFSKLLRRVAAGEEVVIASRGVPVARLVPVSPGRVRPLGKYANQIVIADDFDGPLPDDILDLFEGKESGDELR